MFFLVSTMTMFAISPIRIGAIGSLNSNRVSVCDTKIGGYSYGIFSEIHLSKGFYLCPSVQLAERGGTVAYTRDPYFGGGLLISNDKFYISYLDIPVLLKYKYNLNGKYSLNNKVKIFASAGPTFSNGLKATFVPNGNKREDCKYNLYNKDNISIYKVSKKDIGLGLNIGAEYGNHYQLSIGYTKGAKDIFDKNLVSQNRKIYPSSRFKTFTFSIAYIL